MYKSQIVTRISVASIVVLSMLLSSCNGILSGIYDDVPSDNNFEVGVHPVDNKPGRYLLMLNATSYTTWHFVSIKNLKIASEEIPQTLCGKWDGQSGIVYNDIDGINYIETEFIPTDAQPEPSSENWDFAIHHFDVRTNNGSACLTNYNSIDQLPEKIDFSHYKFISDSWSKTQVIVDFRGMLYFNIGYQNSLINPILCSWVTMDFSTPPPIYKSNGGVYLLKTKDNRLMAMQMINYMSEKGTKGFLTIDIRVFP